MSEDARLSHVDEQGRARMVDVAPKAETVRVARARASLVMQPATLAAIRDGSVAKGAVLSVARTAGIMAAKKTAELIPLCHPLRLTAVEIHFDEVGDRELEVRSEVTAFDRTGVEMEALTACATAALTVYDMVKAVDRGLEIRRLALTYKSGGRSGVFERAADGATP